MKITIKDVAKEAGVSIATVSRVLNKKDKVKNSTRKKVSEAIQKLNFNPDQTARTMINKETKSVGLLVPHLSNEYWATVSEVIQEELWQAGYTVMLCTTATWNNPVEREIAFLKNFIQRKVDGIIYSTLSDFRSTANPEVTDLLHYNIPVVTYDQHVPGISQVHGDHMRGALEAVNHLMKLGHENIGYIGGPLLNPDRELGYRNAHTINGLTINESLIKRGSPTFQFGSQAMKELLNEKGMFSAIFCGNDLIAIGAMQCLENEGIRIPEDVAVVGYDDIDMSGMVKPSLTTVRQPIREMGTAAVDLLINAIENKDPVKHSPRNLVYQMELIVRDSCGANLMAKEQGGGMTIRS
jgi:LacI family transcriptional regulator